MRITLLGALILGCGPPPSAPFRFSERLESRALPAEVPLRTGHGFEPLSGEERASCFSLEVRSPNVLISSTAFREDLEAGPSTETRLRRLFAHLGEDGLLVAKSTARELEAAFDAGAPTVRLGSTDTRIERAVRLVLPCRRTFSSAREFIEQCGTGYVEAEAYRRVGVSLETVPSPMPAPTHFVTWGAPAPSDSSDEAFTRAFDASGVAEPRVRDLTQDLPAINGTRRLARLSGYPSNAVGWCIATPVMGGACLEQLVSQFGILRVSSPTVTLRDFIWRAVEDDPASAEAMSPRVEQAKALRAQQARCVDIDLPAIVARCAEAFAAQRPDVCEQCAVPPECAPTRLEEEWKRLGFP